MTIDFRKHVRSDLIISLFKECTPKLLVVTDNLSYSSTDDFGLTQFVSTLQSADIHGMTPIVKKACRHSDPNADSGFNGFDFADDTVGVKKSRYDVIFLLGFDQEGVGDISSQEVDAIAKFMQAGGGVFATGDHESLGAAMSGAIPRVRSMRYWKQSETPNIGDETRLSTNLPGDNGVYEFDDQADLHPQRLYVNYRSEAGGVGNAHPLLQGGLLGTIEVFPDHPHEGECRVPSDLTTTFMLDGSNHDEWPIEAATSARVSPEMVAMTMSHGNAFPGKEALTPRDFMAISAYDGQRAAVGRVVTDATWHHFVNVNLDGSGTGGTKTGLQNPLGTDTPDLTKIRQYYRNLANWLMPKNVRRCLRYPVLAAKLARYPLFEELRLPNLETAKGGEIHDAGQQIVSALRQTGPEWFARQMVHDALEDAVGEKRAAQLLAHQDRFGRLSGYDIGVAALGAMCAGMIAKLDEFKNLRQIDPHTVFAHVTERSTRLGAARYVESLRKDFDTLGDILGKIAT